MSTTGDKILIRDDDFYKRINVEVILGNEVVELDSFHQKVTLKDGTELKYDKGLVAPGG
jgi:NAD(P)H-nitrite reductase large subunit